jgi:hypothetical protein
MLSFREHQWQMVPGASRFHAYINTNDRKPEDVFWFMDIHYIAWGVGWRRVRIQHRPELWMRVSGFKLPGPAWRSLERLSYWNLPEDEGDTLDWDWPGGGIETELRRADGPESYEHNFAGDHIWRVAARDGRWFTVELAAFTDGGESARAALHEFDAVTAAGTVEPAEPDADFWKTHGSLYLVENVPFGTVTVRVPRNARDAEAHAIARVRTLLATPEPEHIEVSDYLQRKKPHESLSDDLYVVLHFHGYYED